ncbi:MAG: hypothetical protein HY329_15710 [Chloroflexi bacterium]|nr:hypothetical protein [Chloroflexota bacterium]
MVDRPTHPDSEGDTSDDTGDDRTGGGDIGVMADDGSTAGTPLWVKLFGIVALVLVVLFAVLHLSGAGFGPGSHLPSSAAGGHLPRSSSPEPGAPQR